MEIIHIESLAVPWGELALYHSFADKISQGLVPYIDFFPEYPPLALTLFSIANLFGEQWFTLMWYGMALLATVGTMILIKRLNNNPYVFLACILPLGGLFWDRFDIFPAFFTLLSIYQAKKGNLLSLVSLFIGIMIKIYPIILIPVILLMFLVKSIKKFISASLLFIALIVIFILPNRQVIDTLFKYHGNRGIQIESIRATPLLFKDSITEFKHNTFEIRRKE